MITPSTCFNITIARLRSPAVIASSILVIMVRICERRDLLIAVRRAMTRPAFLAELVLAIDRYPFPQQPVLRVQ